MAGFGHVLVAAALHERGECALRLGLHLARRDRARCTLGHVIARAENPLGQTGVGWASLAGRQRAKERAMVLLGNQLQRSGADGDTAGRVLGFGRPPTCLAEIAADTQADLMVVGSGALGSGVSMTTEAIAECSPVSTWAVRQGSEHHVRHVVVALDFSDASVEALILGWRQAQLEGAKLSVICACPRPSDFFDGAGWNCQPHYESESRRRLDAIRQTLPTDLETLDLNLIVASGTPWKTICSFVSEAGGDVLALGRNGVHRGDHRYFLGSTTRMVLRHANCSVLITPPARSHGY